MTPVRSKKDVCENYSRFRIYQMRYVEMSSILADQQRPRIWAQMRGEGAVAGSLREVSVSANDYSCAQEPK